MAAVTNAAGSNASSANCPVSKQYRFPLLVLVVVDAAIVLRAWGKVGVVRRRPL